MNPFLPNPTGSGLTLRLGGAPRLAHPLGLPMIRFLTPRQLEIREKGIAAVTDALTPRGEDERDAYGWDILRNGNGQVTKITSPDRRDQDEEEKLRLYMLGHLGPQTEEAPYSPTLRGRKDDPFKVKPSELDKLRAERKERIDAACNEFLDEHLRSVGEPVTVEIEPRPSSLYTNGYKLSDSLEDVLYRYRPSTSYRGGCNCDLCQADPDEDRVTTDYIELGRTLASEFAAETSRDIQDRMTAALYGDNGGGAGFPPDDEDDYLDRAFERGDVVELNSGGYPMTVISTQDSPDGELVNLIWQSENGALFKGQIHADLLVFSDTVCTLH